jgi:O-antigen/teichoic acid export membrane protein
LAETRRQTCFRERPDAPDLPDVRPWRSELNAREPLDLDSRRIAGRAVIALPGALVRRHWSFVRDVAMLTTGKFAALLVTFVTTPIISRLFEPEHFGIGALFLSLITIAAALATLSYERSVVIAKAEADALLLSRLAFYALAATCALLWLVALAAWILALQLPFADKLGVWTWVLPVGLMLTGLSQIADSCLTRTKQYTRIAVSDVVQSATIAGSRIASGAAFGSSTWGVIVGLLLGTVAELAVVFGGIRPWAAGAFSLDKSRNLRDLAVQYKDFPLYSAPNAFVRMLSQEMPTVMFAVMFTPAVVGYYAMASRLARLPLKLAAAALQRVVLQRLSQIANEGRRISPAYVKITFGLALVALGPFLLLWLFGETLLTAFLGAKWEAGGHYVVILVPWLYAIWVSSPASTVMTVLRRQSLLLKVQILLALARLTVFAWAYWIGASPETTLQAFVAVSAVSNSSSVFMTYFIARKADRTRSPQPPR